MTETKPKRYSREEIEGMLNNSFPYTAHRTEIKMLQQLLDDREKLLWAIETVISACKAIKEVTGDEHS